ncbi:MULTISPECIES: helix-turn-helix domain-containing protein [unclassified Pseudoclavibacter]|uniref:winged helix-turn-helix transcriptional regulator n=1 Tax=unclassified Pseudoclavibacter TaxID=2615177 RepID=UPI0021580EDB|nr:MULTISPECIES: helix-turn-helix domain-containing protein [unclassified Pseudoclavibacter]
MSAHTLSNRLRRFETYGLVTRTAYAEVPPRVVYELTEVGQELQGVLDAMNAWVIRVPNITSEDSVPILVSCSSAGERASVSA